MVTVMETVMGSTVRPDNPNKMRYVRPFLEADIPQVADLHRRVFHTGDSSSLQLQQAYRSYFAHIYFQNPWRDPAMPSFVYQEPHAEIAGFLGVLPRKMSMNGRTIRAAVSSQFIVDPATRSTLAGLQLLGAFFAGPQDLSIADEANDVSRKLWEAHGGTTALLYSLYWFRLLQPTRFLLSRLSPGLFPSVIKRVFEPLCRIADAISHRVPSSPFRLSDSGVFGEELSRETLLFCLSEFSRDWSLRPDYDDRSLKWLLEVLAQYRAPGSLHRIAVQNADRELIGWYLYLLTPKGLAEVLQIGAKPNAMAAVLGHLVQHSWQQGATALSGRIEPRFMQQFREKKSQFHHRGSWILLHSNQPEVLQAIHSGDAFLTRLEGEWCMRFHPNWRGPEGVSAQAPKTLETQLR